MILRKVILAPFGGFASREILLEPGMNVICGPNDIGKSTLEAGAPVRLKIDGSAVHLFDAQGTAYHAD